MDYKKVGQNIRKYRKGRFTQEELAEMIGKSESSIRKYEKGLVEIPNSVLELIASKLDVDFDDLIDEFDEVNIVEPELDDLREEVSALRYSLNKKGLIKTRDYMRDLMKVPEYKVNN